MATLLIDPTWLTDSFTYRQYVGKDEYGGVLLNDAVEVTVCKVDQSPSYQRNATENLKIGDATIFCYADFTKGVALEDLTERSEVTINGETYTVKQVRLRKEIDTAKLYAVEVVVL